MKFVIYTFLFFFSCFFPFKTIAQDPGDDFFSAWTVHEIRFQFSQTGFWDSLKTNYTLDQYMRADVTIDGTAYPQSGVKYKGNSSYNNASSKKPFRIDLAEYVDDQTHDGLKKLVLNNGFKDPTLLREKLMLDYLNAHGIAAPRCGFAKLYVNNEYRGLYTVIEDVNKTFLEDRFGNKSGNLFKGDPKGTLNFKGDDQSMYMTDYELKTNETANDWSDLIRFIKVLNNSTTAQLPDSLPEYLNLNSWYDYWAAHNLFVNLDSYVGSGHNYFVYHNDDTGLFEWITWDVNEAFGNFTMGISLANLKVLPYGHIPMPGTQRPMMSRLWTDAFFKQQYADRYCALLQDFSNTYFDPKIDSLANLIRDAVYADTYKFFPNNQFEQNLSQDLSVNGGPGLSNIAGLKPFVAARRASLIQQLGVVGCTVSVTDTPAFSDEQVSVLPNPVSDLLLIQNNENQSINYRITDITGQLKAQGNAAQSTTIKVAEWPAGLYLVHFSDPRSGAEQVHKIFKSN